MMGKTILELSHMDARDFFLKHESYVNFELPEYFSFEPLIKALSKILGSV
jgi:hypothetical protein